MFFFFKQKTAYEMRISDWSSDVGSSDLESAPLQRDAAPEDARPGRREAEAAVRTLIRWAGDHPSREGLADTPARVVRAYEEWFGGYALDPEQILGRTFEGAGYDDIVLLRDIPLRSTCEHHRSEERRVGKECVSTCRSRCAPYHQKKKINT